MKPAPFDYAIPDSVPKAVSLLMQYPEDDALILAGGQSLMPLLNMRLARPDLVIDIGRLTELSYIRETDEGLAIGALTTKRAVEQSPLVKRVHPLLHAATLLVGHPQIRNRGTVGGSLAHADPAAEYPAVALALDAGLQVVGRRGDRTIRADDFFVTFLTTALDHTDILTEVRLPALPERTGWSIREVSRRHGDFAVAGAVATLSLESGGRIASPRIVLFGVASLAVRAREAEEIVTGERPVEALFARAAQVASEEIENPPSDVHASSEYRRHLVQVLTQRALAEAAARAASSDHA